MKKIKFTFPFFRRSKRESPFLSPNSSDGQIETVVKSNPIRTFFANAKTKVGSFCKKVQAVYQAHPKLLFLLCFFVPALIMFFVHGIYGVYPFGKNSILVLDMNAQYVFFFEALRRAVYGDASLLYSFSRNLGGEFAGIYAYYIASPLSYIVALFPKDNILEALYTMIVLKCGLCGLTFSVFVKKIFKVGNLSTFLFSCCYALSGYGMIMQHNTMWTDCEILLPLVCLGVYSLVRERKYKLYVLTLALAILSNYYIGYMMCLFMLLFFFYCYFSQTPAERNPKSEKFHFLRALTRMGIFSLIAVLIACIIILPAYYSLTFGKNEFSNPTFEFISKFPLFDLLGMFLFNAYDTVRPEGMPILYCGILSLLLIPLFFLSRKFSIRERLAASLICFALLISFSLKFLDLIWHGFQTPNWLNYRYSFMLIFLLAVFASRAFDRISETSPKSIGLSAFFILLGIFILQCFGISYLHDFSGVYPDIALISLYAILLALLAKPKLKPKPKTVRALLSSLVLIELAVSAFLNLYSLDCDVVVSNRTGYRNVINKWKPALSLIEEEETDLFYRTEYLNRQRINESFAFGTYGVTGSTSTLNAKTIAFLSKIGISAASHWGQYSGSSPLTDSILSIKYLLVNKADEKKIPSCYTKIYEDSSVCAFENPYSLPLAFAASPNIAEITFNEPEDPDLYTGTYYENTSPFAVNNIIARTLLGSEESLEILVPLNVMKPVLYNLSTYPVSGHICYSKRNKTEYGSLTFDIPSDGIHETLAFFPTKWQKAAYYYLNDEWGGWLLSGANYGYVNLGVLPEGSNKFVIYVSNDDSKIYIDNTVQSYFYSLNEENLSNAVNELRSGGLNLTSFTEDTMSGTISVPEGRTTVFTTIPFDKGWIVSVDGQKVETYEILDALLAFDITPGEHTIEMHYMPDIYVTAFKLSMVGVASFLSVVGAETVYRLIKKKKENLSKCTTI